MQTIKIPENYIDFVRSTRKYPRDSAKEYVRMGLFGKLGEIATILKKAQFNRHGLEAITEKLADELMDCVWYLTAYSIETYCTDNVEFKLHDPIVYADITNFQELFETIWSISSNLVNNNFGIILYSCLSYILELVVIALDILGYTLENGIELNMAKINGRRENGEKQFSVSNEYK